MMEMERELPWKPVIWKTEAEMKGQGDGLQGKWSVSEAWRELAKNCVQCCCKTFRFEYQRTCFASFCT
jgi:hypothetical protein